MNNIYIYILNYIIVF